MAALADLAEPRLIVRVNDAVDPTLSGHGNRSYESPPQTWAQARALIALLLHLPDERIAAQDRWTKAIAGGRRTVTVERFLPATRH